MPGETSYRSARDCLRALNGSVAAHFSCGAGGPKKGMINKCQKEIEVRAAF
jgi:hypothetical protein